MRHDALPSVRIRRMHDLGLRLRLGNHRKMDYRPARTKAREGTTGEDGNMELTGEHANGTRTIHEHPADSRKLC